MLLRHLDLWNTKTTAFHVGVFERNFCEILLGSSLAEIKSTDEDQNSISEFCRKLCNLEPTEYAQFLKIVSDQYQGVLSPESIRLYRAGYSALQQGSHFTVPEKSLLAAFVTVTKKDATHVSTLEITDMLARCGHDTASVSTNLGQMLEIKSRPPWIARHADEDGNETKSFKITADGYEKAIFLALES